MVCERGRAQKETHLEARFSLSFLSQKRGVLVFFGCVFFGFCVFERKFPSSGQQEACSEFFLPSFAREEGFPSFLPTSRREDPFLEVPFFFHPFRNPKEEAHLRKPFEALFETSFLCLDAALRRPRQLTRSAQRQFWRLRFFTLPRSLVRVGFSVREWEKRVKFLGFREGGSAGIFVSVFFSCSCFRFLVSKCAKKT